MTAERLADWLVMIPAVGGAVFVGMVLVKAAWQATAGNVRHWWRAR